MMNINKYQATGILFIFYLVNISKNRKKFRSYTKMIPFCNPDCLILCLQVILMNSEKLVFNATN